MTALSMLRRLVLLAALLPQLFLLGLGRGVVVCMEDNGHVQVEVSTSMCCSEQSETSPASEGELPRASHEPDCGSCSDFPILLDQRRAKNLSVGGPGFSQHAPALLAVEGCAFHGAARPALSFGRPADRGRVPSHLNHLRSVVLRR